MVLLQSVLEFRKLCNRAAKVEMYTFLLLDR
ncbi:hypothetical protein DJ94_4177 [Bacillus pseudomycoides]|nr:hypothetical protein DJ94_4177 [Bacillus pseudomycoides]